MKLTDLNPQFLDNSEGVRGVGVAFDCPCGNSDEEHRCFVPFDKPIGPGETLERGWKRSGETFDTLTLTPSIQRTDDCRWHGYITNGIVITA
jgi:hypothetical protein